MADKTTGELESVSIGDLAAAPDIYDDLKMPGEMQGDAVHITGAQFKKYAQSATKSFAEYASASAATAEGAKTAAQSALDGVREALNNLPEGDTLIINDLTTGGTSAALSAEMGKVLGSRPNPNLLHNWYFANPVNQRGQTEYTNSLYTIDRWGHNGGTVQIGGGLSWQQAYVLYQPFEYSLNDGKRRIFSYLDSAGNLASGELTTEYSLIGEVMVCHANTNNLYLLSTRSDLKIVAVKLELGATQTLAHWDGGNWVLNEIPDYGEELAKCQRYQTDIAGYYPCVQSFGNNGYWFAVQLPCDLRIQPNVDLSNAEVMTAGEFQTTLGKLSFSGMKGRTLRFAFDMTTPTTLSNPLLYFRTGSLADSNL